MLELIAGFDERGIRPVSFPIEREVVVNADALYFTVVVFEIESGIIGGDDFPAEFSASRAGGGACEFIE